MTYDVKTMRSPRVAGSMLRALALAAESQATSTAFTKVLLKDTGITAMRAVPCHEPLTMKRLTGMDFPVQSGFSRDPAREITLLGAAAPALHAQSFRFESVADFTRAYREHTGSPVAVAQKVLDAVREDEQRSPRMRVFIAQDATDVMKQAQASEERWRTGQPLGPLDGVPVAVKDELDQTPYPTTVGTRFLGKTPADRDATAVQRLRDAGAVLIGKTNMQEMGLGVTGINSHHGAARNPYDPPCFTGGSSSGSAAAVASGMCPIAVGADGGGSIRIPSGLCGVVGLKPTFGRVSEVGAAPLCWSVAHVGPLAATVDDCALAYLLMAGPDQRDPNSLDQGPVHLDGYLDANLRNVRLGIYPPWFQDADADVVATCTGAVDMLKDAGATVVEVEIPRLELLRPVHLCTILGEMATAHLLHYRAHRKDYGPETRVNLALAQRLTAFDYLHAQRLRAMLNHHFAQVLDRVDVLVTPTTACTSTPIAEDAAETGESNAGLVDRLMRFAQAGNLTGLPAISVPAGHDSRGMPVGLQLMGRAWDEALLLRLARVVESRVIRLPPKVHHRLLQ